MKLSVELNILEMLTLLEWYLELADSLDSERNSEDLPISEEDLKIRLTILERLCYSIQSLD